MNLTRPFIAWLLCVASWPAQAALQVVVIEGLGGEPRYTQQFDAQAHAFAQAATALTETSRIHLLSGTGATRSAILNLFHGLDTSLGRDDRLLLYLVGHGSFDGTDYKFNIPGPDLTAQDLATLLNALPAEQQLIVATGSASGALLEPLRRAGRSVITATRNGNEKNATRFGTEFAAALTAAAADSDKNGSLSAAEAYAYASRRVADYFQHEALLASEHPTLDGDTAARFTVASLRGAVSAPGAAAPEASGVDPSLLQQRTDLNGQIETLRLRKEQLPPDQYSSQLEALLLQLAQVQERIDARPGAAAPENPGAQ